MTDLLIALIPYTLISMLVTVLGAILAIRLAVRYWTRHAG